MGLNYFIGAFESNKDKLKLIFEKYPDIKISPIDNSGNKTKISTYKEAKLWNYDLPTEILTELLNIINNESRFNKDQLAAVSDGLREIGEIPKYRTSEVGGLILGIENRLQRLRERGEREEMGTDKTQRLRLNGDGSPGPKFSLEDNRSNDFKKIYLRKINEQANEITRGEKEYRRFSEEEQRGLRAGGSYHVAASLIAGRSVGPGETQDEANDRQEEDIEKWAKRKKIWMPDTGKVEKKYKRINAGKESLVYFDKNRGLAVKSKNTYQYRDLQDALDGITLFNTLCPATALKVVGFGRNAEDDFQIILEQPYITEAGEPVSQEEVKVLVESMGYSRNEKHTENSYINPDVILNDLHEGNVIRTPEGNIAIIDAIMHLNTAVWGYEGTRGDIWVMDDSGMRYSLWDEGDFDADGNVRPEVIEEIRKEKKSIITEAKANGTYLKAPNGKPTKLNEEQWVMVRTSRFKRWFGDWELAEKLKLIDDLTFIKIKNNKITDKQAEEKYNKLDVIQNKHDSRHIKFVKSILGKLLKHKGIDTKQIIPQLSDIVKNAILDLLKKVDIEIS